MQIALIFALAIAILAVIFALQNIGAVTVAFFAWQFSSSLALVLLITLAIGVILSLLFSLPAIQKRSWKISKLEKSIAEKDKSLEELEALRERAKTLRGQLEEMEANYAAVQKTLESKQERISQMTSLSQGLQNNVDELEEQLQGKRSEIGQLNELAQTVQQRVESLVSELNAQGYTASKVNPAVVKDSAKQLVKKLEEIDAS